MNKRIARLGCKQEKNGVNRKGTNAQWPMVQLVARGGFNTVDSDCMRWINWWCNQSDQRSCVGLGKWKTDGPYLKSEASAWHACMHSKSQCKSIQRPSGGHVWGSCGRVKGVFNRYFHIIFIMSPFFFLYPSFLSL